MQQQVPLPPDGKGPPLAWPFRGARSVLPTLLLLVLLSWHHASDADTSLPSELPLEHDWKEVQPHVANKASLKKLARRLDRFGYGDKAIEVTRELLRLDEADDSSRTWLASQLQEMGRLQEAERIYVEVIRRQPNLIGLRLELGRVLEQQGKITRAVEVYREAAETVNDENLASDLSQFVVMDEGGEWEDRFRNVRSQMEQVRSVLAREPANAYAHLCLARIYSEQLGWRTAAMTEYREAIRLDNSLGEAYAGLGRGLAQGELWDLALQNYDQALAQGYADTWWFPLHRANALLHGGHVASAIAVYHEALLIRPDNTNIYLPLAKALYTNKEYVDAWYYVNWATALGLLSDPEPSFVSELRKVAEDAWPAAYAETRLWRAYGLLKAGAADAALQECLAAQHAEFAKPEFAWYLASWLSQIYGERGQIKEAIGILEEALSHSPSNGILHLETVRWLTVAGDYERAWRHVRLAEEVMGNEVQYQPIVRELVRKVSESKSDKADER